MALHWIPPPSGVLKINVHGTHSRTPLSNGNDMGIGAIYRNSEGQLKYLTTGVIPYLTPLGNQLWAMFAPLHRAFLEGYRNIILETDNLEAYLIAKYFRSAGAPASVYDIASQLDIHIHDRHWICKVVYIYPSRTKVARYLARLGMETGDRLYTFQRPVEGVEELLEWDLGMGIDDPDFMDVFLPNQAPDPVNFDVGLDLSGQMNELGLGQFNASQVMSIDVALNEDAMHHGEGFHEDFFHGGVVFNEALFSGDVPLDEVD